MAYKCIREWPEDERPRERLLKKGPENLSDAQLVAILLRTGGRGRSAMDMAIELLGKFGNLRELEQAPIPELCSMKGLGRAKAAQLKAALELGRRSSRERAERGCSKCGYTVETDAPPEKCPSCREKCEFLNVTCYIPECGITGSDPRLT